MRRQACILLLVMGATPQAYAWKSKKMGSNSPHESQTRRAVELLRAHYPSNAQEWIYFQKTLEEASGSLIGDSNAHGNILFMNERVDPEGNNPATNLPNEKAISYNGGPFYRYWIRAVEAHGQVAGDVPPGVRRFRHPASSGRKTLETYLYFGYLAHLVEDQCVPAHACNVRHGPWEGVEWWHWEDTTMGGKGGSTPLPVANLLPYMDSLGWDTHTEFLEFWNAETSRSFDRGIYKKSPYALHDKVHHFLQKVVINTQDRWSPGLISPLRTAGYFNAFVENGQVLKEPVLQSIWDGESRTVKDQWALFQQRLVDLAVPADGSTPDGPKVKFFEVRSQFKTPGSGGNRIWAGGQWRPDPPTTPGPGMTSWWQLNDGASPWLPHPDYTGEPFDARWGSYGGKWGFPGRVSVEGHFAAGNYVLDALTNGRGRITPGDIYTQHKGDYDPFSAVTERVYVGPESPDRFQTGYRDERSFIDITVTPELQDVGFEQINKAAMWTAVLLENLSKALPPRIVDLQVTSRKPRFEFGDISPIKPISQAAGASIELKVGVNRMDEYEVEFYAVPQKWFRRVGADQTAWRKPITLGKAGIPQSLWPSDITVNVTDYGLSQDDNPTNPSGDPFGTFSRDYDYVYDQMPVIPLKVIKGYLKVSEASLDSNTSGRLATEEPVVIPPSQVIADQTPGASSGDVNFLDRDPYSFSQLFTWTGEVGDPKGLFNPALPEGAGQMVEYIKDPKAKVKTLREGDYFLLAVVYRKHWRDAFARNQYKILYRDKELLEKGPWWSSAWDTSFYLKWRNATQRPDGAPMIPDELVPFRYDATPPRLGTQ